MSEWPCTIRTQVHQLVRQMVQHAADILDSISRNCGYAGWHVIGSTNLVHQSTVRVPLGRNLVWPGINKSFQFSFELIKVSGGSIELGLH